MKKKTQHIAIAGNIGVGKSSLVELLSKHFGWAVEYEAVNENPYLTDFYEDMKRWAFHVQVCFLNSRFEQLKKIQQSDQTVIQDRSIYEDAYVFAKSLSQQGILSDRDYQNYQRLFNSMMSYVQPPDLLIYLKSSVENLQNNIKKRNRAYEADISSKYLQNLNQHYNDWLKSYDLGSLLIINADQLDFVNQPKHFKELIEKVEGSI